MPVEYIDEMTPPWRTSPSAWIEKVEGDVAVLAGEEQEFQLRAKVGEVVKFSWQELVAERPVRVWDDHHVIEGDNVPADSYMRISTTFGEGGFLADTLDEFIEEVREAGHSILANQTGDDDEEWPIAVTALFYRDDLTAGSDFRLIDTGGALAFVPAEQVQ